MVPPPAAGVVLAGGESRRMGRDKALLEMDGESLVARSARKLAAVCPEILIADAGRSLLAGLPSLQDGPGRGPASGILGAAHARPGRPLLVLAVDLPHVPIPLLEDLVRSDADLVFPQWTGGVEPLCALYGPAALAVLEERVRKGRLDLHTLAESPELRVRWLDEEDIRRFGNPETIFRNLNTPADLDPD